MAATLKKRDWRVGRNTLIVLICALLLSGQAFGRTGPPAKKKKATPSASVKRAKPAPAGKVKPKRVDRKSRPHPFELDANAKLICEQTTVTAEPVWQGRDKLTFSFNLRNAGTADLKIKAKGG